MIGGLFYDLIAWFDVFGVGIRRELRFLVVMIRLCSLLFVVYCSLHVFCCVLVD